MKKKPIRKYHLVHIKWHDAAMHGTGQVSFDEVSDFGIMYGDIAGWLIYENDDYVTIAMDFFPASKDNHQDNFRTLQSYPKSGIEKTTILKTLEIYEYEKN